MKREFMMSFILVFLLFLNINCASTPEISRASGNSWLSSQTAPPEAKVDGTWYSDDWGKITLTQTQGTQNVSGRVDPDGGIIDGVVTDKKVYLIFSYNAKIYYSAILTVASDNLLTGVWARELITERSKTEPMKLIKK